jgi:hypothetical protein
MIQVTSAATLQESAYIVILLYEVNSTWYCDNPLIVCTSLMFKVK